MRIHIGIDPVLFTVFGIEFRWYSLAIMVSIVVAVWFIAREFRRKGIDDTAYGNLALIAIASGILGARLFHIIDIIIIDIIDDLGHYLSHSARILDFQSGGLAIYGAVIGGFIGVVIGCRIYDLPLLQVIDAVAPGVGARARHWPLRLHFHACPRPRLPILMTRNVRIIGAAVDSAC